jgi:arylformamidase
MIETDTDTDAETSPTPEHEPHVYRNYEQQELDAQYDQATLVPDIQAYERAWHKGSDEANERLKVQHDLAYGDSPRQKLDLFVPAGDGPFPVVAYFHGGGWTRHGKEKFAFPAPAFVDDGVAFACIGFDLLPDVTLADIPAQCRRAVDWLADNADELNIDADALFVAGHSSGAHLAALTMTGNGDIAPPDIKAALLLSGIFDLEPLRLSARNEQLNLDVEQVKALSPIENIPENPCPVVIACGGGDLGEFRRQSHAFAEAWENAGGDARIIEYPNHNHFSMTEELADATGEAMQAFLALIDDQR